MIYTEKDILKENENHLRRFFEHKATDDGRKFFAKVERITLDRGGYSSNGRYYGTGFPLFSLTLEVQDSPVKISWVGGTEFRAATYQTARSIIKEIGKKERINLKVDR